MRIGTTPTHTFTLPSDIAENVAKVRVIYSQCGKKILHRDVTELSGNDAIVKLTQAETFKFNNHNIVKIQLRVLLKDGDAMASDTIERLPHECLENEVLV